MKNLQLVIYNTFQNEVLSQPGKLCQAMEDLYYVTSRGVYLLLNNQLELRSELSSDLVSSSVGNAEYVADKDAICILFTAGQIVTFGLGNRELEHVGEVSQGLHGGEWSPDQEKLVVLTKSDTLILMTSDFDPILETDLNPKEFGENPLITVGWGSKDTQFHGSEGKQAAKVQPPRVEPVSDWDDGLPRIRWRGDSQMFVTSSVDPKDGARRLRVWSHEGSLLATSEDKNGLEHTLDWRPSGNLIVTSQQLPSKHEVVFFEKNGLQHGSFTLGFPPKTFKIQGVAWNIQSSILCVWGLDVPADQHYVLVFTTSNYHYYLKHSLRLGPTSPGELRWDLLEASKLHLVASDGSYRCYVWNCASQVLGPSTMVAVNGARLLLSPFEVMVVPPPMCAVSVVHPAPISHVALSPDGLRLACVLDDHQLALLAYHTGLHNSQVVAARTEFPSQGRNDMALPQCYHLNRVEGSAELCHWTWLGEDSLVAVKSGTQLWVYSASTSQLRKIAELDQPVLNMCSVGAVWIQLQDGSLLRLAEDTLQVEPSDIGFPAPCPHMEAIVPSSFTGEEVVVGCSAKGVLYHGHRELAQLCTSFRLTPDFLVYVSMHCKLGCLPLSPTGFGEVLESEMRRLEEGSELLCVVPLQCKVVVQLPRGNLETMYPRPLMMRAIVRLLDSLEFGKAFQLMKVHRINMGLIYSHHPKVFKENVDKLVQQIPDPHLLNIFLTSLRNIPETNEICQALREELEKQNGGKYLLSILTSYVIAGKVEEALLRLSREDQDTGLSHLVCLSDANTLYNTALGLYDFDLVTLVAAKTQKDPKEYVPFLTELKSLEPNYRKFRIDCYLEKYSKALEHLVLCCPERQEECVKFVKAHGLYCQALALFPPDSDTAKVMWGHYAEHLESTRQWEEAGLAYQRSGNLDGALQAYQHGLDWQMCLALSARLGHGKEERRSLLQELIESLVNANRLAEAAHLAEHFLHDPLESLHLLMDSQDWEPAYRLAVQNNMVEEVLQPALITQHKIALESAVKMGQELRNFSDRLATVRATKAAAPKEESDFPELENQSQQSTAFTASTTTSRRSSKSRRKLERKKFSLKEGSEFEDIALVVALYELVGRIAKLKDNSRSLVKILQLLRQTSEARELVKSLVILSELVHGEIPRIWPPQSSPAGDSLVFGPQSTVTDILNASSSRIPDKDSFDPRVKTPPAFDKQISWVPAHLRPTLLHC